MSDNTLANYQSLNSNCDGINDAFKSWQDGLTPDPFLTVSQWSDKYRFLSPKAASEPGRWRTDRTPYLREIMDCLSPSSPVQRVVFMKGSQIGATEAGCNWIGYVIQITPGPMLAVSPTVELAKRNSKQRIDPLIEDCPELGQLVQPARSRDSGNTVLSKDFPGGVLVMTGANSAVGLRSMPARFLFMDEVDGYPGDVDGEGDPILLAERRSATFQTRRKIFLVSTPTIKGISKIEREFQGTDCRYFFVPCPHCDHYQHLVFEQLYWPENEPDKVQYRCESCEELIAEHHKNSMLAQGAWRSTKECKDAKIRGYHLSSLYSPIGWFSWAEAAKIYEQSKENPELLKGFVNTVLGAPFEEECEVPDWERLYERRETYEQGVVPPGGLFLTCGVDVQKDRIECEIVAWGRNKESWSVDFVVLDGNTAEQKVWRKLSLLLNKDWATHNKNTLPIRVMCVDSGYATQDVYNWARQFPQAVWGASGARASTPRTVVAIKGRDQETALVLSVSKADTGNKRRHVRVWNVGGPVAKLELYRWLNLPRPTDEDLAKGETYLSGTCHFPQYGEHYFKQLTAERRVITHDNKGFSKAVWQKDPARNNEALDCRVYARVAAHIYGLDRFKESQWQRFEDMLGQSQNVSVEQKYKRRLKIKQPKTTATDDPYL